MKVGVVVIISIFVLYFIAVNWRPHSTEGLFRYDYWTE